MPFDSLFNGLVIGDDRFEPPAMVQEFRDSGLSHLTAVSGQNVAYVIAAAAPLIRRLRPASQWAATVVLVVWFVAITRFEPSVVRAGSMAVISVSGYILGRQRAPARVLALAVGVLVVADPLLVWSVGFWMSVMATAGVSVIGPRLRPLIPGPAWLAEPASVSIGAQLGVAPISLAVFGQLPLVAIPANLLAVPVAGFVMLYGLPAGLTAGAFGRGLIADLIQVPSEVGTRWVATVASLAARLEPPGPVTVGGWGLVVVIIVVRRLNSHREFRWLRAMCHR